MHRLCWMQSLVGLSSEPRSEAVLGLSVQLGWAVGQTPGRTRLTRSTAATSRSRASTNAGKTFPRRPPAAQAGQGASPKGCGVCPARTPAPLYFASGGRSSVLAVLQHQPAPPSSPSGISPPLSVPPGMEQRAWAQCDEQARAQSWLCSLVWL